MTHLDLSDGAIRDIVADMRQQSATKREQSRALHGIGKHDRAFGIMGEAVVIEHWAMRLESLVAHRRADDPETPA